MLVSSWLRAHARSLALRATTRVVDRGAFSARFGVAAARWLLLSRRGRRVIATPDLAILLAHPSDAAVLLDAHPKGERVSPEAVLTAGRRPEHHSIARELFVASGLPGDRSETLYGAVTDTDTSPEKLALALRLVEFTAREMAPAHRRPVLERSIQLGAPPVDPYAPAPASSHARWAATALLLADPALDDVVFDGLRKGGLDRDGLLLMYAEALLQRERAWRPFVEATGAAALAPEDALRFAASCDRRATTLEQIRVERTRGARLKARGDAIWARLRSSGLWAMPLSGALVALVYATCATYVAARTADVPGGYAVDPGDALAALSLLVAAVIFAAELAADRLHGLIARRVALSPALASALMLEVVLLVAAGWLVSPADADNRAFLQALLIGGLVVSLITALVGLLRRTDALRAIELYARRRRRVFGSAGKVHGAVQAAAIMVRAEIPGFGWAKLSATRAHSERRAAVAASRRGFVVVNLAELAKMDRDSAWRSQDLRLRVTAVLGDIVPRGEEIASVVPDTGAIVRPRDLTAASRAVTTRSVGPVAEAMEAVGALVTSVARLAATGNLEAAERASNRLVELLRVSVKAARRGRPKPGDGESVPVSPLARVAVDRALSAIRDHDDSSVRGAMEELLDCVAGLGEEHEALAALVVARFTLVFRPSEQPGLHTNILWHCARRAVDADDSVAIASILQRLDELMNQTDSSAPARSIELAGWIGAYAAWTRPHLALHASDWLAAQAADPGLRRVALHRLGSAAMLAGVQSLALRVAYILAGMGPAMRAYGTQRAAAAYEQQRAELYGLTLGDDPQWALLEFADLVIALAPAAAPSS